jgi:NAD(P)-dependent dehydrogenase (short-subunit alcohol dehydrogenase family)
MMNVDNVLQGKTCIVTGATNGIGEATALGLAQKGARVIGIGRSRTKCAEVSERIKRLSGNPQVEFLIADLSVQEQVCQLAETIHRHCTQLDVLVNNAGGFFQTRQESADGIEMTWALNHLNYFLLTNLLLDLLKASAPSRVICVSSDAHRNATLRFDDPEFKQGYRGFTAYGHSKLANVLFTYELAHRLEGTCVTANALHPGFVSSGFGMNNGRWMSAAMRIAQRFGASSPEKGAQTSLYLASSPAVENVTGQYFAHQHAVKSSPATYDRAAATRLWHLSEQMTHQPQMA